MGRLAHQEHHSTAHPDLGSRAELSRFYGDDVPGSAILLDTYARAGVIPLREPGGTASEIVFVDLHEAADALGADRGATRRHLHTMHAAGLITIDAHGCVEVTASAPGDTSGGVLATPE